MWNLYFPTAKSGAIFPSEIQTIMAFITNSITRISTVTVSSLSVLDPWVTQSGCTLSNQSLLCFTLLNVAFKFLFTQKWLCLIVLKLLTQAESEAQSSQESCPQLFIQLFCHMQLYDDIIQTGQQFRISIYKGPTALPEPSLHKQSCHAFPQKCIRFHFQNQ